MAVLSGELVRSPQSRKEGRLLTVRKKKRILEV